MGLKTFLTFINLGGSSVKEINLNQGNNKKEKPSRWSYEIFEPINIFQNTSIVNEKRNRKPKKRD